MAELNQDVPYSGALRALDDVDQRLANLQDLSGQDMAQGQEGMATGLNLSPATGSGGFDPSVFRRGLDAITPSQETMGRIFAGLEAGGAHLQGRTPLFMHLQEQQAQLQLKRDQMAMQLLQHQQQQHEHQFNQAFQIMSNKELPWSQKKKMLASDPANSYARLFQHVGDESLAADFENILPYLDPADVEAFQKNPDEFTRSVGGIAGVEAKLKTAQERQKATIKEREQQRYNQTLFDKYRKDPNSLNDTEFNELNKLVSERVQREQKQRELDLQMRNLAAEAKFKENVPKEVYSGLRGPNGEVVTGIYHPQTGKTTEMSGIPLQRTQELPSSVRAKNMEVIDMAENVHGIINQYRQVLKPENVGLIGDLRGLVFGAGQQADAFSQLLKGQATSIVDQLGQTGSTLNVSNFFDPSLSKAQLLGNVLTYQLAFMNSPDGRVSNDDFKQAKSSLGLNTLLSGAGEVEAKLQALEEMIDRRASIAEKRLKVEPSHKPKYQTIEEYKKARGIK